MPFILSLALSATSGTLAGSYHSPFTPVRLPKLLIVHDNRNKAANASSYLNPRLPLELQSLEICQHYHSEMSAEHLENIFASFLEPDVYDYP